MTAKTEKLKRQRDHWFPFYAADFLGSTQTMKAAEVGVYLRLLLAQWLTGGLPHEVDRLCRIAGPELRKAWPVIGGKFQRGPDGLLRNRRLEEVRAERIAYAEQRRAAANLRWSGASTDASGDADAMHMHAPRNDSAYAGGHAKVMPLLLPPDLQIPEASPPAAKAAHRDPKIDLWNLGVSILTKAGKTEAAARGLLGKWIRDHGETAVAAAVGASATAADPAAYIAGILRRKARRASDDERHVARLPGDPA